MGIETAIAALRADPDLAEGWIDWRTLPAQPARYGEWPSTLDARLRAALARDGIEQPYTHQAQAFAKSYAESGGKARFEDYTLTAYDRIAVHERLRRNVVFFHHNLVSDYALGEMNVVFCRNVLIYFGPSLRDRVLGVLRVGLRRGGFLCLGANESLPAAFAGVFSTFARDERIFRLRGEA